MHIKKLIDIPFERFNTFLAKLLATPINGFMSGFEKKGLLRIASIFPPARPQIKIELSFLQSK